VLTICIIAVLGLGAVWYLYFRTGTVPPGVRIVLVGDSTVADYPGSDAAGWGEFFPQFVGPGAVVINHAKGGRSSKTFITEGRWKRALASRPQVVIIQFGHNDIPAKPEKQRTSAAMVPSPLPASPHNWYRHNLAMMVREARATGAIPIVVAPMERMQVGLNGELLPKNQEYAEAAKVVANDEGAMLIDLNTFSIERFSQLGEEAMLRFHTKLADGHPDRTHFNKAGGRYYAAEVVRQIIKSRHEVASLFTSPAAPDSIPDAPMLVAAAA
jgi:lysophospholipase L1-like esterase